MFNPNYSLAFKPKFKETNSKCIVLCKVDGNGVIKETKVVAREMYDSRSYHTYKDNIHYFFYNKTKMKDSKAINAFPEFSVTTITNNWEVQDKTTEVILVASTLKSLPVSVGPEHSKISNDGKTIYFLGRTDIYAQKLLLLKYELN